MDVGNAYVLLLLTVLVIISSVDGFFSFVMESAKRFTCQYIECCEKDWSEADFNALESAMKKHVYGQGIANEIVLSALRGHLRKSSPRSKALTMSFHGRPGVGKNYVASIIQNILFKKGSKVSKYTHFYSGRIDFPLESETKAYQLKLKDEIVLHVKDCEYSVFVFDEVDKMPPMVLDILKPLIDYHEVVNNADFRKTIFIFLSNTGGDHISKRYLELWKEGRRREDLKLRDFEDIIRLGAFNERGGLFRSATIESSLIDHYIPFLPLEEIHVSQCIKNEFDIRGYTPNEDDVKEIMQDVEYGPAEEPIFSNAGCKRISQKVMAYIERKIHWEL